MSGSGAVSWVHEIEGFRIADGLDETGLQAIRDTLLRHSVVVLRDQHLTPRDQLEFTDRLAPVERNPARPAGGSHAPIVEGVPEIVVISNIVEDGRPIGLSDAGVMWHTDMQGQARPELFGTLSAVTIPVRDGVALGDTRFTRTAMAYEALDDAMKARLAGLRGIQSYAYYIDALHKRGALTRPPMTQAQRDAVVEASHPIVRTHPITGRKLLYVSESYTDRIEGMDADEGRALIDSLSAHLVEEVFQVVHRWREGDLLIWDNCATQHLATFDYGTMPRRLHRCGTTGPVPE
ncbi:MAG: TauD/TfdA family dioxygenase [Sphingomonadales bacterium]|nr:MAG: TauD/TfdA family dioxygenase [Sphingomonadales bacterium]